MAANGLNKATFIGNVGNIDSRFTQSGKAVATVSLAVQTFRDEEPVWVRLVAFDKKAEVLTQYAPKGTRLYVEARYSPRKYERDGVTQYSHEFIVNDVLLLSSRNAESAAPAAAQSESAADDDTGDDLPF